MSGLGWAILGLVALAIGLAVYQQVRWPDLWAQRRAERREWERVRAQVNRERLGLVPHTQAKPNLRVVPTPAPRDRR